MNIWKTISLTVYKCTCALLSNELLSLKLLALTHLKTCIICKRVINVKYSCGDVVSDDTVNGVVAPCYQDHHHPSHRQQCKAPVKKPPPARCVCRHNAPGQSSLHRTTVMTYGTLHGKQYSLMLLFYLWKFLTVKNVSLSGSDKRWVKIRSC